jgi:hypothetical protein
MCAHRTHIVVGSLLYEGMKRNAQKLSISEGNDVIVLRRNHCSNSLAVVVRRNPTN